MHYVICYDIENDRLRDKSIRILTRNGCLRVQKSVFVAPNMEKKHLVRLQLGLQHLFNRHPLGPADSVYILPLPNESAENIDVFGANNIVPALAPPGLKIIL